MEQDHAGAAQAAGEVFYRFIWTAYDNLGKLILANVLWFAMTVPFFTVFLCRRKMPDALYFAVFLGSILLSAIAYSSVAGLTFSIAEGRDTDVIREFFSRMKKSWRKSAVLSLVILAVALAAVADIRFYAGVRTSGILRVILTGAGIFILFAAGMMQDYIFPLLAQRDIKAGDNLKTSAALVIDNFGFTFIIFFQGLLLFFIFGVSLVGIPFFFASFPSLLFNTGLKVLSVRKYGMPGELRDEKRGWKEFWQPWKT